MLRTNYYIKYVMITFLHTIVLEYMAEKPPNISWFTKRSFQVLAKEVFKAKLF